MRTIDQSIDWAKQRAPQRLRRWLGRRLVPWTTRRWVKQDRLARQWSEGQVIAGPFKGMQYIDEATGSALGPKLLGTYEMELRSVIEQIIEREYPLLIDIGGAEGYYAVGLLTRMPTSRMIAFESTTQGRRRMGQLAQLNGVSDRLTIRGICTATNLHNALDTQTPTCILCDVDGGERDLLDPAKVPALAECDMLVEVHDLIVPGVDALIQERFSNTHLINRILPRPRTVDDVPAELGVPARRVLPVLSERRQPCPERLPWFWMTQR